MKIAPSLASHWYVGGQDLRDRLVQLYVRRIECVHGMVPFTDLRAKGELGADEAARLEYLAEMLAREAIRFAFRNPQHAALFADRTRLEQAWAKNQFP